MVSKSFEDAYIHVKELAERFAANEAAYLAPRYQEAEARNDFINPFFVALGWDVYHHEHPNPYEREVKIEKSVMVGDRGKRADYAFYTTPNYHQARFLAEAKKPSRQLENQYDCFQAIRYGWNSNTPLAVLTDFEQFIVLDSRYKPTVERSVNGILEKFHYKEFADEETFRKLYYLFSRESVGNNSLEKFVEGLKKTKGKKTAKAAPTVQIQPVGDTFLTELDVHRENLARAFKRSNNELDGEELTEITQWTLDRLVFIRFLEDKLVEPSDIIDRLGKKTGSSWRDFANEIPRLNQVYNGIIFKPHAILDSPSFAPDSRTFDEVLGWLSHKNSAYDFNSIPIHILGSIYERFLGKTITVSDKRAKVEEKPEVRKAGGVYYTPEYIVRYIVENTIGKLLHASSPPVLGGVASASDDGVVAGRPATPDEIAKMRFADIACGSGSFLLGIFDYLIKYHVDWYSGGTRTLLSARLRSSAASSSTGAISDAEAAPVGTRVSPLRRREAIKKGLCRETSDGTLQLTLEHKRDILLNNIYGVDLDAQAVEVAHLSLYLKLLEEETAATVQPKLAGLREQLLPNLNKNIVHGNSLIDYDIMDGQLFSSPPVLGGVAAASADGVVSGKSASEPGAVATGLLDFKKLNPMSFQSTFPEVFATGGFDAIVGNPPYIRIQGFPAEQIRYFTTKFQAATGNFDIYVNFIERAYGLLNEKGMLGEIVPNKFFKTDYGIGLRSFVAKNHSLSRIVDFGSSQVFDATTYTCLFFLTKELNDSFEYSTSEASAESLESLSFGSFTSEDFDNTSWVFANSQMRSIFEKLGVRSRRLLDVPAKMSRGSSSGNDDIFMVSSLDDRIEDNITRIPVFATDFSRYSFSPKNEWKIIFPYAFIDQQPEVLDEDTMRVSFPKAHSYLNENKELLLKRKQLKEWYGYSAPRNLTLHEHASIVVPLLANRGSFALIPNEFHGRLCPMASGGFTISLSSESGLQAEYLLGLLNSTLLFWKLQNESNIFRGGWITCTKQYFGELPIRTIDFNNPTDKVAHDTMVGLVEKMIAAKKSLATARTDADRQFYERFSENLDRQIDELVYKLYDITPEERKIIEGK